MRRVRVHQHREVARGRPFQGGFGRGGDPHRRVRLLQRFGEHFQILEMEMLPGEIEPLVGPRLEDDLDCLAKAAGAFVGGHPEGGELNPREAAPSAPIDPPARNTSSSATSSARRSGW